jgi:hypothetical protein
MVTCVTIGEYNIYCYEIQINDNKPRAGQIHGKQSCRNGGKSVVFALPVRHDVSRRQFISLLFLHFLLAPSLRMSGATSLLPCMPSCPERGKFPFFFAETRSCSVAAEG